MRWRGLPARIAAGILALYTLYYPGFGWLPEAVARGRVLYYLVISAPLLGSPEADLALAALAMVLVYILTRGGWPLAGLSLALLGYALHAAGLYPALALLSPASLLALYTLYRARGLSWVLEAAALLLLPLEALGVLGALAFLLTGSWPGWAWGLVVRERGVWAIVSWTAPLLLLGLSLYALAGILSGRGWRNPFTAAGGRAGGASGCRRCWLAVPASAALAALLVLLPHLPSVDPGWGPVSVDSRFYLFFIWDAEHRGLQAALQDYSRMARPLYLAALYAASRVVPAHLLVDIIHPIAAITLLALASYAVVGRIAGQRAAALAALLAASGRAAVTFIIGGFQANSIALPLALLMLTQPPGGGLAALGVAVALIHPWTYTMYAAAYVLAHWGEIRRWAAQERPSKIIALLTLLAAPLALAEAANRLFLGSAVHSVAHTTALIAAEPEPAPLNIYRALTLWTWGSQDSPLTLLAAATAPPSALWAPLAVVSPLLLLTPEFLVHRLILNSPLEQLAATSAARAPRALQALVVAAVLAASIEALAGMTPC